jgi:xanthine dehydrogenase large subunit
MHELNILVYEIEQIASFVSFVSHIDIPGTNTVGIDEEVFISSISSCIGAMMEIVVCESEESAEKVSKLIKIEYKLLTPTIFTIEDAIIYQSYFGDEQCLRQGDINQGFIDAEHELEGMILIGGQEHFYLETN